MEASSSRGTIFLDSGNHNMRAGQQPRQVAIAFIGDDDRGSRFSHEKIRTGDSPSADSKCA